MSTSGDLSAGPAAPLPVCPGCGAPYEPGASFCEGCGRHLGAERTGALTVAGAGAADGVAQTEAPDRTAWATADPVTAAAGEESPLDVGWTGPVAREEPTAAASVGAGSVDAGSEGGVCRSCGDGHVVDGYCDVCGSKARDPRDHYEEEPAPWVAGVCDIGRRHSRNEDALALHAEAAPQSFAVLVVCDGVSNTVDSHIASLAASRAARDVLERPMPRGAGTRSSLVAAAEARLGEAVQAARAGVVAVTPARGTPSATDDGARGAGAGGGGTALPPPADSPPSCTVVAAVVVDGMVVVGNVGDSRAYWLPDDPEQAARQLSRDDSYAQEQMESGVPRGQAETGPGAHAITRWLGVDSPDDVTPHTADLDVDVDGWLVVCSDGLWNYCSEATDLRALLHASVAALGAAGLHPLSLAGALTDWANECGGTDNITVALARVGTTAPAAPAGPTGPLGPPAPPRPTTTDETKDTP